MIAPVWTAYKMSQLAALWNEGLSCKQIAQRMDITRNAVIGKAHRLGLKKRPSPIKPRDWDDKRFARMWEGGVIITHMEYVFKCDRSAILRHVHVLGLKQRPGYVPRARKPRILKKSIYHPVPAPEKPVITVPQFGASCRCGSLAVPGIRVCYACGAGEVHAGQ